jgi:hypothetical protein
VETGPNTLVIPLTCGMAMILHVVIAMVAGWLQRHKQPAMTYVHEEYRVLKAQRGGCRLRLTDRERRRPATVAHPLGRPSLQEVGTMATPENLLRWYTRLIAPTFDRGQPRRQCGGRTGERRDEASECPFAEPGRLAWPLRVRPRRRPVPDPDILPHHRGPNHDCRT